MALTIQQIRDNCVRARHLMQRSRQQHFAVGAFNIDNQETLIAVCRAAHAKQAPVLVEVSDGEVKAVPAASHERERTGAQSCSPGPRTLRTT